MLSLLVSLVTLGGACERRASTPGPVAPPAGASVRVSPVASDRDVRVAPPADRASSDAPLPLERTEWDMDVPVGRGDPDVEAALREVLDAHRCNTVQGCPAADRLVAAGPRAIGPVLRTLGRLRGDHRALPVLVDVAGRLRARRALPVLRRLLADRRPGIRARAVVALGRIGASEAVPWLQDLQRNDRLDAATRGALAYTLERLHVAGAQRAARRVLAELLAPDRVLRADPGQLVVLVPLAVELRVRAALPGIRMLVGHTYQPLALAAIDAVVRLHDRAAIRALVDCLADARTRVRRQALDALAALTGRAFTQRQAWLKWCDAGGCPPDADVTDSSSR